MPTADPNRTPPETGRPEPEARRPDGKEIEELNRQTMPQIRRIDLASLLGDRVHRFANLLFRMLGRDEEPQPGCAFFHRRVQNRLHVDPTGE